MFSLLSALRVTILPSKQKVILQKVTKGVTKLYNITASKKKGGDKVIPLEFNLPSLSWTSFIKGIQNIGPYFAHLRKRKKDFHT